MKYLVLILWFSVIQVTAQENFKLNDHKITWEKVYTSEISKEAIQQQLRKNAILNPVAQNFSGTAKSQALDCDQSQAIYMRAPLQFFASIDFKEGKYRVTVSAIEFIPEITVELSGVETTNNPEAWEDYALKNNGAFRSNNLVQNSKECIDAYLTRLFTFEKENTDW